MKPLKRFSTAAATALAAFLCTAPASSAETSVTLRVASASSEADGVGASLGTVRIVESRYGLVFQPALTGLAPGLHGLHLHENPSCAAGTRDGVVIAALAAGGHLDPQATRKHGEPWGEGHLGDLPALYVAADGSATQPVLAPRLKFADLANRSLMVHAGGDNHADHPAPLGGGGARVACGVLGS